MKKSSSYIILLLAALFFTAGCDKEAATSATPSGP
jgi:PBP1b-binding outer membrane lipoprotein LpoB